MYGWCITVIIQRNLTNVEVISAFVNSVAFYNKFKMISTYKPFQKYGPLDPGNQPVYFSAGMHDDVIKWKHRPRYWPLVRGIHRSLVNSPHKGQWRGALIFFLNLRLAKRLNKQLRRRWFKTSSRSLWRHYYKSVTTNALNVQTLLET